MRNVPGSLSVDEFGVLQPPDLNSIEAFVVHYSYDGLGRVIRVQRPAHSGSTAPIDNAKLAITDLYYDGVRVVQEVGWGGNAGIGGGTGVPVRVRRNEDGDLQPDLPGLPRRANEMTGTSVSWGDCAPTTPPTAGGWVWQDRRLEREYIWAGDSPAYVDECFAQMVSTKARVPRRGTTVAITP